MPVGASPVNQMRDAFKNGETGKLRDELWIILPFFIFSVYVFLGSFRYKFEASTVPKLIGLVTAILTGMRLYHILFPKSKIGQFKEEGIAGEFDSFKERIEEERLKGRYEEEPAKTLTFKDERKAFLALFGSCAIFLLFGYLVGIFFVIVGTSYYYGYKQKRALVISLISTYFLVYVILYRLLGAPADFGMVMTPLLRLFRLI